MRGRFLSIAGFLDRALPWLGGAAILAYVCVALLRIRYPFELEWMEGGSLDHVRRVLEGKPLYAEPSLSFTPFLYPPLYYLVSAGFAKLLGLGFGALRSVSLLSSLASFGLLFELARRETRSASVGLVAAGLFAACFRLSGEFYDLARVDSLALALLLGGVCLLRSASTATAQGAAGALLALSFLAKQTSLVAFFPALAWAVVSRPRPRLACAAAAAAGIGLALWVLHARTGGWFGYYAFALPAGHAVEPRWIAGFWTEDLLPLLPALLLAAGFLAARRRRRDGAEFAGSLLLGALASSWLARAHVGGWDNVLMPAHAALCLVAALALGAAREGARARTAGWAGAAAAAAPLLLVVQFGALAYDPSPAIPGPEDREAGRRLVEGLSSLEGEVLVPAHPYLLALAGKPGHAHLMAISDVLRAGESETRTRLQEEIERAMASRRYGAVITDEGADYLDAFVASGYRPASRVFDRRDVFWPATGLATRPDRLWIPAGAAE